MKNFWLGLAVLCSIVLVNQCAPKPVETIDLSKARATLQLADGSSISMDGYDDVNPILVQDDNDYLLLVFASNRPCSGCTGGYHLFIAESVEPYDPFDPLDVPAFHNPVVVINGGPELAPSTSRFNFQAGWVQGSLRLIIQSDTDIAIASIAAPDISTGNTMGSYGPIPNMNRYGDDLISVDFRTLRMISKDFNDDIYISRIADMGDSGTPIYNDALTYSQSATPVVPAISGYTDALLYEYFGYLAYGQHDDSGDFMDVFNEALDREELELSYVSAMNHEFYFTDLLVFSAGFPGDNHDLYIVDSHTVDQLWFQNAEYGVDFTYTDNFNIFISSPTASGSFGGIAGADALCNTDFGRPDRGGYYKAMLVDGAGNRVGSASGGTVGDGQVDWVLQPLTTYIRGGMGDEIAMTDGNALFSSGLNPGGIFSGGIVTWTGFSAASNWGVGANHCSNWASTAGNGTIGISNDSPTGYFMSNGTPQACASSAQLYCVEQP